MLRFTEVFIFSDLSLKLSPIKVNCMSLIHKVGPKKKKLTVYKHMLERITKQVTCSLRISTAMIRISTAYGSR